MERQAMRGSGEVSGAGRASLAGGRSLVCFRIGVAGAGEDKTTAVSNILTVDLRRAVGEAGKVTVESK
jgi:hypothetical protein